jgi:hypothetical protein
MPFVFSLKKPGSSCGGRYTFRLEIDGDEVARTSFRALRRGESTSRSKPEGAGRDPAAVSRSTPGERVRERAEFRAVEELRNDRLKETTR